MRKRRSIWFACMAVSLMMMFTGLPGGLLGAGTASATAASPTVTGPVGGGTPAEAVFSTNFDLSKVGYEESEYFVSGTASSYSSASPLTTDGKWTATPDATAAYTTRAVVRRPIDPTKFNGTVIVEWLNVSGAADAGPDWTLTHNELIRDGFAWVGVSAQQAGVNAAKGKVPKLTPGDPVRYAALSHPGDSFSYDIFSQAGQAIRDNSALMLSGLTPQKVIAAGESQSAGRLVTYIDAVQPLVHVYDGFLVHSRFSSGEALSQTPQVSVPAPATARIRDDLDVPVFVFETETDVLSSNLADRQPDTSKFRLWEVAGTSHYDDYGLGIGPGDTGDGQGAVLSLAAMQHPPRTVPGPVSFSCNLPINTGGAHWVLDAAVYSLNQWVVNGTLPPHGQLMKTTSVSPVVFARDANGNVLGGVRSPQVDAPIAALGGVGNGGTGPVGKFCFLFGTTKTFSAKKLAILYKNHSRFVTRWDQAATKTLKGGFLRQPDAVELEKAASASHIGK
jgi:hypothetical protein